jgi:hypothetical protein
MAIDFCLLLFLAGLLTGIGVTLLVITTPDVVRAVRHIAARWGQRGGVY